MEVVGAVAATFQLLGIIKKTVQVIAELQEHLQDSSSRVKGWQDELSTLSDTMACIRHSPRLHTGNIETVVISIAQRIGYLRQTFAQVSSAPDRSPVKKLFKAFSARAAESRILDSFAALERDKATLILTINTISGTILSEYFAQAKEDMPASWATDCRSGKWEEGGYAHTFCVAGMDADRRRIESNIKFLERPNATDSRLVLHAPVRCPSHNPTSSRHDADVTPTSQARSSTSPPIMNDAPNISQNASFQKIKIRGSSHFVGNSSGKPGNSTFEEVDIDGSGVVLGVLRSDPFLVSQVTSRSGPGWTMYTMPMQQNPPANQPNMGPPGNGSTAPLQKTEVRAEDTQMNGQATGMTG
ncbi:hypothetical protein MRS44_016927 [Fusarium solani]|jgi:hypothetical protein|uniref:uncharacterized protein n=1 Tax=Fusarium solani TaxID=169388 RepID=UPI0032C3EE3F|nr:hypothetical protein MRS44_016927 [Fusarium solani]